MSHRPGYETIRREAERYQRIADARRIEEAERAERRAGRYRIAGDVFVVAYFALLLMLVGWGLYVLGAQ